MKVDFFPYIRNPVVQHIQTVMVFLSVIDDQVQVSVNYRLCFYIQVLKRKIHITDEPFDCKNSLFAFWIDIMNRPNHAITVDLFRDFYLFFSVPTLWLCSIKVSTKMLKTVEKLLLGVSLTVVFTSDAQ